MFSLIKIKANMVLPFSDSRNGDNGSVKEFCLMFKPKAVLPVLYHVYVLQIHESLVPL